MPKKYFGTRPRRPPSLTVNTSDLPPTATSTPVVDSSTSQALHSSNLTPTLKRLNARETNSTHNIKKSQELPTQKSSDTSPRKRKESERPAHNTASAKRSSPANHETLRNDRLGTLVQSLSQQLLAADSWESFVNSFRGPSYLAEGVHSIDHPAARLLQAWKEEGVPAMSSEPNWTLERKDHCIERGCHRSAIEHSDFLREEMADFIDSGFWTVLPYSMMRHHENLMLSPSAVKDERDRRPRLLCDHSWYTTNEYTIPHAPPEAMQFGGAIHRVLREVRHANPKFGPVRLAKHDIKDGFYRMFLRAADCPRLAIVLPKYEGEPQLIAIPMSSTMGWQQSPPTFSTMSETVTDETNRRFREQPTTVIPHRLESTAASMDDFSLTPVPRGQEDDEATRRLQALATPSLPEADLTDPPHRPSNRPFQRPVGSTDVFVDDFIQLGQGSRRRMKALRCHLFHSIDQVLARPDITDMKRNEAVSLKKLLKADGSFATRKLVLGWIIDSLRHTLELPAHRKETLANIFEELSKVKRVSNKRWMQILGKLRFVSVAIPGSAALLGALQWAQNKANGNRIRINTFVRDSLNAFCRLAASLCSRPTSIAEIVPQDPSLLGATDAARQGMGGVYFDSHGGCFLWRQPFSQEVQARLVTFDNPNGTITNSDLEQAAQLAQLDLMTHTHDITHATIENFCDNTPTVSRAAKGAVSTNGPAAYLCRYASAHQRLHRYCHRSEYLPGVSNRMGDDASRLQHLTDSALLAHFEQHYPQSQPWTLLRLNPDTSSKLTSALLCTSLTPPTLPRPIKPGSKSGTTGAPSAPSSANTHPSVLSLLAKRGWPTSSSSDTASAKPDVPADLYGLAQWRTHSWRWARGYPTWVNQIHASNPTPASTSTSCISSSKPCATKTHLQAGPTQPTSLSSDSSLASSTQHTPLKGVPTSPSCASLWLPSSGSSDPLNTYLSLATNAPPPTDSATSPSLPTDATTLPAIPL